jgi:hypothetical protein
MVKVGHAGIANSDVSSTLHPDGVLTKQNFPEISSLCRCRTALHPSQLQCRIGSDCAHHTVHIQRVTGPALGGPMCSDNHLGHS